MFPQKTPPSAAEHASAMAKSVSEGAPVPAASPEPTPAPAVATPPIQIIPLQCTMCGNRLLSVWTAQSKTFTHVHQVTANAPKCPVTGKKFRINASHEVEEVSG